MLYEGNSVKIPVNFPKQKPQKTNCFKTVFLADQFNKTKEVIKKPHQTPAIKKIKNKKDYDICLSRITKLQTLLDFEEEKIMEYLREKRTR